MRISDWSSDVCSSDLLVLVEYRNLVRDPVDMTAAMLARCGGAKAFAANHQAIFAAPPIWLGQAAKMSKDQQAGWYPGRLADRTRRIPPVRGLDPPLARAAFTTPASGARPATTR